MNKDHETDPNTTKAPDRGFAAKRGDVPEKHLERQPGPTSGFRRHRAHERQLARCAPFNEDGCVSFSVWRRSNVLMISTYELAEAPDGSGETIPQWHISMSYQRADTVEGKHVSDEDARAALACLGMGVGIQFEEDNHHPGLARHFWMPLDPKRRVSCECKVTEETIVQPDGYTYTTDIGSPICRGCELEASSGIECPDHPNPEAKIQRARARLDLANADAASANVDLMRARSKPESAARRNRSGTAKKTRSAGNDARR